MVSISTKASPFIFSNTSPHSSSPELTDMMAESKNTGYNKAVEDFREREFPMIQDSIYLDHAGATLCPKSTMDAFAIEMTTSLYGNPHSASPSSQRSTSRIEDARMNLLSFFGADPSEYDIVFVANATAGVKLVVDAMRSQPQGWRYAYHQASHTSLVGAREEATHSICVDDDVVESWISGAGPFCSPSNSQSPTTLFSYSAQSHMNGKRYPLTWSRDLNKVQDIRKPHIYTLLDASSFSATSPLSLDNSSITPDFIVLSLYKIFGFPDLGALIVRRSAETIFDKRKYFGGGTVDMVVSGKEQWHASKSQFLHERLEDGTLPFHNIVALDIAMDTHQRLFGSMDRVKSHTTHLMQHMVQGLSQLRHANGEPVCLVYTNLPSDPGSIGPGPVVSFNIKNSFGAWTSLAEFEKLATLKNMHVRTGGLCSPGDIASVLNLQPWEMKRNFSAGYRCGTENDIMSGKPTGVIRASLGAMSTVSDVERFVSFVSEFYQETTRHDILSRDPYSQKLTVPRIRARLQVKAITVYPIKSCSGFSIPPGIPWEVRPEGLAWDREWCLLHQGSGHALSQKRCPRMALLQPSLDFDRGLLVVKYCGEPIKDCPNEITIPLSANPAFIDQPLQNLSSRVCGENIATQIYSSNEVNEFFSRSLGVPCVLARFPPGGNGTSSRLSKAQMQKHQQLGRVQRLPGSFPEIPSPPDSDSENQKPAKILLSNESPILMISSASVDALNTEIIGRGGDAVSEKAFRANIVLAQSDGMRDHLPFAEDDWESVQIGQQNFKFLGACRRCQMVCVNQETGERKEEPYVTLAKTRRFDGKVYFGVHMQHDAPDRSECRSRETQYPTIEVGEPATVEVRD